MSLPTLYTTHQPFTSSRLVSGFILPHSSFITHSSSFLVHRSSFIVALALLFFSSNIRAQCPQIVAIMVDACGTEQLNEFVIIRAGDGFNTADIRLDYDQNANVIGPENNDINTNNGNFAGDPTPCGLTTGNIAAFTGCSNLIAVGSGVDIPASAIVVLQTSFGSTNSLYNFSSLCGAGQCIYVIASACTRSSGAFTNAGAGTRTTVFSIAGTCTQTITYNRASLSSGANGDYYLPLTNAYGNSGCTAPPLAATTGDIWTGCLSTDWATAGNWLDGSVPTATDNVTIPDVTNDPVIMGGTAAVANSVSVNTSASLTINDMGSLTINGSSSHGIPTAGLYNEGTVTNSGNIILGSTASVGDYGLWNLATFDNNSAPGGSGEIRIDRSSSIGLYNNSGTFTNTAKITIGAVASAGGEGIRNEATFDNSASGGSGEISIDRSTLIGLYNASGTFTNEAKITIGAALASVSSEGILNEATFDNNSGGEISIDRSTFVGLYNLSGTFTNKAKITIGGALASAGSTGIRNDATFDNSASGGSGEIRIDRSTFAGLYNFSGTFTNTAKITIGAVASVGGQGIRNDATFNNSASGGSGEISLDGSSIVGLFNQSGTFTNTAKITIGAVASVGSEGIRNFATFDNSLCSALINIVSNSVITNSGTFDNAGGIIENASGNSSISTNSGTVQNLQSGMFTIGTNTGVNTTAAGDIWTGCTDTDWHEPTNWLDRSVPTAADNATIPNQTNDPTISAAATSNSVNVLASGSLTVTATGSLTIYSAANPLFTNGGTVMNEGTVSLDRTSTMTSTFNRLLNQASGTFTNKNVLQMGNTGVQTIRGISNFGAFVNESGGSISMAKVNGGIFVYAGTFTNYASIEFAIGIGDSSSISVASGATFLNTTCSATILCLPGGNLGRIETSSNGGTFNNDGLITENSSGSSNISHNAGIIQNLGGGGFSVASGNAPITNPAPQNSCCATPTAFCKSATIVLVGNSATLSAAQVDNGSTTDCDLLSSTVSPSTLNCSHVGTPQTVTLTITDIRGASDDCQATVTVLDQTPPTITCPGNINKNTDPNQCTAITTYSVTASDNCSYTLTRTSPANTASGSAFPKGTTTVSWQVTDVANLSTDCSFTVTVTDAQVPTISCPANIVRSNDANQCHAVVTYADPTATDNCAVMSVLLTSPANTASGSQFPAGAATTVIWEATDNAPIPNKKTCSFTVKVNDTQKPTIACPPNKTVGTDAGACSASVTYVTPTATDNCNSPGPTVIHVSGGSSPTPSGLNSISTFDKGVTTVKWKATDAAGNTKECTFKVTVNDLEKPMMTCLSDMSANNDAGLCSAVVSYTLPTFTDNCPPTSGQSVKISGPASGSAFSVGTTNVVYRATDASGNTKQCTMKVTVTDNQPPTITCPGPIVVTGSGSPCKGVAVYATPTASDNCSGSLTPFLLSGLASGSEFPAGVTTNTWRAIAGNGQTADCAFTVTVECPGGMMNGSTAFTPSGQGAFTPPKQERIVIGVNASRPDPDNIGMLPVLSLVPNPATTQVEIWIGGGTGSERLGIVEEEPRSAVRDLSVFDAQGRMVWQQSNVLSPMSKINVAEWPSGLYFVTLRTAGATLTKRLAVSRL